MIAAVAPMSMSEERLRGSLDLLASTMLSSRAIVVGKWLGTLRLVFLLLAGPGLVTLALATSHLTPSAIPAWATQGSIVQLSIGTRIAVFATVLLTIIAHGALLTSLGLFLAIWLERQSRAIAINVCALIILAVGWPLVAIAIGGGPGSDRFMMLSPLFGVIELMEGLAAPWRYVNRALHGWTVFWDAEVAVLALGLLWLSVGIFDGCFGRNESGNGRCWRTLSSCSP
jgi:ABC-type Na+ efflux pump permease subunit